MQIYNVRPITLEVRFTSPQFFLNTTNNVTATSNTMIIGLTYSVGSDTTAIVPSIEPINVKGNNLRTKPKSTILFRKKVIDALPAPKMLDILLLPNAMLGGKLVSNMAGTEINPPPPTIESTKPANAPATPSSISIITS